MTAAVEVKGLTRRFGTRPVLDAIDLSIVPGEFVALIGRSGSGKSTLLRTLSGLDPVTEGQVTVPGRKVVVFQEHRLLPWKTAAANVALGLNGPDAAARTATALAEVDLAHRAQAWPLALSGGEAQRVALARALVREPELLLLDEPFAALDALTRLQMQALVLRLWQAHRPSVLLVTHDITEAVTLADRVLLLEDGRIALDLPVPVPRPRRHGDAGLAALETRLLAALGLADLSLVERT